MIKTVIVNNYLGDELVLSLTGSHEEHGLYIKSITGIGPGKATINTTDLASDDGGIYNSARAEIRNIVITLGMYQSTIHRNSIEDARQLTYQYFPLKKSVLLTFITDNRALYIEGYVESNDPDIFSEEESTQISIICPDPNFYNALGADPTPFGSVDDLFEFPGDEKYHIGDVIEEDSASYLIGDTTSGNNKIVITPADLPGDRLIYTIYYPEGINLSYTPTRDFEKYPDDNEPIMILGEDELVEPVGGVVYSKYYEVNTDYSGYKNRIKTVTLTFPTKAGSVPLAFVYAGTATGTKELEASADPPTDIVFEKFATTYIVTREGEDPRWIPETGYQNNSLTENLTEFGTIVVATNKTIVYSGEVETGFTLHIHPKSNMTGFGVYNVDTGEKIEIDDAVIQKITGSGILAGDEITICTVKGQKSAYLMREGVTYNIINALGKNPDWLQFHISAYGNSDNIFALNATTGSDNIEGYISFNEAFQGV